MSRSTRALGIEICDTVVKVTSPVAQTMESGGVIESERLSASVEAGFDHERAPWPGSETSSLARRRPQSRWSQVYAAVHAWRLRVGRPRRGPTSGIPDGAILGHALELRALASTLWSAPVRPNYALERSVMDIRPDSSDGTDKMLDTDLQAWRPAQRER